MRVLSRISDGVVDGEVLIQEMDIVGVSLLLKMHS